MPTTRELEAIKRAERNKRKLKREQQKRDHPDKSKQAKLTWKKKTAENF